MANLKLRLPSTWWLLLVPFAALFAENSLINAVTDGAGVASYALACEMASIAPQCSQLDLFGELRSVTALITAVVFGLYTIITLGLSYAWNNRPLLAFFTGPTVVFFLLTVAVAVLAQGATLAFGWYLTESILADNFNYIAALVIVSLTLLGALSVLKSAFSIVRRKPAFETAIRVKEEIDPELYAWVDQLAEEVGTAPPANIIIGESENFYVTTQKVSLFNEDQPIQGRTLYLSSPLMHVLTVPELKAIICHELGHFAGKDLFFSKYFVPLRAALFSSARSLSTAEHAGIVERAKNLLLAPFRQILVDVALRYEAALQRNSRSREYKADLTAAEHAGPNAFVSSLLKISYFGGTIDKVIEHTTRSQINGRPILNNAKLYASAIRWELDEGNWETYLDNLETTHQPHPFDSHPSVASRLLPYRDVSKLTVDLISPAEQHDSAANLIPNIESIERELTRVRNLFISRHYECADQPQNGDTLLSALAAYMVLADGQIDRDEIKVAEQIATRITSNFDFLEFREFCLHPETLPSLEKILHVLRSLDQTSQQIVLNFMEQVSDADGEQSAEEVCLLNEIVKACSDETQSRETSA